MKNLSVREWELWKRKRRHTFIGFIIVSMVTAADYSFMFVTLYHYLKFVIKAEKADLYFGLIIGGYHISSSLAGLTAQWFYDKYRTIKLLTNVMLTLEMIGSILYIIPSGIVYPFMGRVLSGVADPYLRISSKEINRIYIQEEGDSAMWWLKVCRCLGSVIGSVIVIVFKNVGFQLGVLNLSQINTAGILVTALIVFSLLSVNFLIHNCSTARNIHLFLEKDSTSVTNDEITPGKSERTGLLSTHCAHLMNYENNYDHADSKNNSEEGLLIDTIGVTTSEDHSDMGSVFVKSSESAPKTQLYRLMAVLYALLANRNSLVIFVSTCVLSYSLLTVNVMIPLIVENVLRWKLSTLAMVFAANGIVAIVLKFVTSDFCVTDSAIYYTSLLSLISLIISFGIICLLKVIKRDAVASAVCVILFVTLWSVAWLVQNELLEITLMKMVHPRYRNIAVTLRNSLSRFGYVVAAITVPLCVSFVESWSAVMILMNSLLLMVLLSRRKSFVLVREIDIVI